MRTTDISVANRPASALRSSRTYGVDVEELLYFFGIRFKLEGHKQVQARCTCPFEELHRGGRDTQPSFYMDIKRGLFYCHGCGFGGNIITFVEQYQGISRAQAKRLLTEKLGAIFGQPPTNQRFVNDRGLSYTPEQHRFLRSLTHVPGRRRGTTVHEHSQRRIALLRLVQESGTKGFEYQALVEEAKKIGRWHRSFAYETVARLRRDNNLIQILGRLFLPDEAREYVEKLFSQQRALFEQGTIRYRTDIEHLGLVIGPRLKRRLVQPRAGPSRAVEGIP